MLAAKDNPCRKFQANIFNKTKCQNCFKPRESHLLCDEDLNQAKPVYGGWLCLAPEGTDFENPMQRSRKWQRRFFLLFEHGGLRYALDELTSTLPQGTVNMNQATEVVEAESRTGQKNSLCIATPDREYFIRAETKEDLNGWYEMLGPYPRANKQNQKKKRKVDPPTQQEPGPAKVTVTSTSIPAVEKIPDPKSSLWQEELKYKAQRSRSPSEGSAHDDPNRSAEVLSDHSSVNGDETDPWRKNGYFQAESGGAAGGGGTRGRGGGSGSGSSRSSVQDVGSPGSMGLAHPLTSPTHSDPFSSPPLPSPDPYANGGLGRTGSQAPGDAGQHGHRHGSNRSRTGTTEDDLPERMELDDDHEQDRGERQGRSEKRAYSTREEWKKGDVAVDMSPVPHAPLRRAKSLDRRTTESLMTPDLLNFKKGWMVKLDDDCQWKKHWFVLTDHGLKYYKDSIAEEASDLDGEIDLSTCYNVTEVQAQRNYGFQIQTKEGSFTLSAMTTGIRRNWIQAIMKNVRPSTAPDVTSFPEEKAHSSALPDTVPKQDARADASTSLPAADSAYGDGEQQSSRKSRARDRRREGRSKTFDWAEFRPVHQQQALAGRACDGPDGGGGGDGGGGYGGGGGRCASVAGETQREGPGEPERDRARRWEERRKRYSSTEVEDGAMDVEDKSLRPPVTPPPPPPAHDDMQDEIEQRWHQVEQTPLRESKQVPINSLTPTAQRPPTDGLVELLEKEIEALKLQLQQTQQELTSLQERNSSLHSQLTEALQREQSARLGYVSQATCERGFAAMEESHQKVIEELQRAHQAELEKLRLEKDRLLAEETAATIAAIEAMKKAHREELERELEKARKSETHNVNQDMEAVHEQHEEEMMSVQREIEVLSEQYSQKCLEGAHLVQALDAERQALRQCQRENQELNAHNQELNNRLAAEISRLRGLGSAEASGSPVTQGVYELEVLLRVKESEIQYLKQEINSLKEELQTALRDKKYAADKHKDTYKELSFVRAKAERDMGRLQEQVDSLSEALGDRPLQEGGRAGFDIMKSKSNPDILKMARPSSSKRADRALRSKVSDRVPYSQRTNLVQ